jgi:hypothetical protein
MTNRQLAQIARERGGFTYNVRTGALIKHGFAVGTRPDSETAVALTHPDVILAQRIHDFIEHHWLDLNSRYHLGAWVDDGQLVLDLVQIYHSRIAARYAAAEANQQAYFDLTTEATYYVAADAVRDEGELFDVDDGRWDNDPNPYHGDYSEE